MKYLVVVGGGIADHPLPELGSKTPLEAAPTPELDALARDHALLGKARMIPAGLRASSDTALLSFFGVEPRGNRPGRGPLEALNLGVETVEGDVLFRVNLVTIDRGRLVDHAAGRITDREAGLLVSSLEEAFRGGPASFHPGKGYRAVMRLRQPGFDWRGLNTIPAHDIIGRLCAPYLPRGRDAALLTGIMEKAGRLLESHPVNGTRLDLGENPANAIWPSGQGEPARLFSFAERYHLSGAVISALDGVRGIGKALGMAAPEIPGATGYLDTDYEAKARAALDALTAGHDFVLVHVEAPDEASHEGTARSKLKAITDFDHRLVAPLARELRENFAAGRLLVTTDHFSPLKTRTHASDPVPFLIWGSGVGGPGADGFNEACATSSRLLLAAGHDVLDLFLKPTLP